MNNITIVSQVINQATLRFGGVDAVEVPEVLWEKVMDEVADAGGEVGLDYCLVDGVAVRLKTEGDASSAAVHVPGRGDRPQLPIAG